VIPLEQVENPRRVAIETIRAEHRALAQVLSVLASFLRSVAADRAEADFQLLSLALQYIDDFPRRLHHPKEDRYLFAAIRRHTHAFDNVIAALEAEHEKDAGALLELHRLFVLYQAGAARALEKFESALKDYSEALYEHMRKEEALLDDPHLDVPESEWQTIAQAFAANQDPLFGPERRREFDVLHNRIVNLLPRKMRHAALGDPS
jgi:branched-chain amino acid transport system ATP-binding protein